MHSLLMDGMKEGLIMENNPRYTTEVHSPVSLYRAFLKEGMDSFKAVNRVSDFFSTPGYSHNRDLVRYELTEYIQKEESKNRNMRTLAQEILELTHPRKFHIAAIRILRQATGGNLRECKDIVLEVSRELDARDEAKKTEDNSKLLRVTEN